MTHSCTHRALSYAVAATVAALAASASQAAIPGYTGGTYGESFDALVNSPTNASLGSGAWQDDVNLAGWFYVQALNAGTEGGYQRLRAGTGSSSTGSMYSFGSTGSTERALGWVSSNTLGPAGDTAGYLALRLRNTSTTTFTEFTLQYNGEQWRTANNTTPHTLDFSYKTDAAGLMDLSYTTVPSLSFTGPVADATAAAVDGNVAGRVAINSGAVAVTGITWEPGQDLWLRWTDTNDANADHGLAIDDLSFTAGGALTPTAASPTYNVDADGSWSNPAVWLNGTPNVTAPLVRLGSAMTANRTVDLDVNATVNGVMISNGKGLYTLSTSNNSTLTINAGGGVTVSNGIFSPTDGLPTGAHTISAPLSFATDAKFQVGDLATLNVTGTLTVGPGGGVTLIGPGSVSLPPSFTWSGPTTLDRATITLSSASQLGDGSPTNTLILKNGAGLNFTADVSMTRAISFDAGGFTIRTDNNVSTGPVSGPGMFRKVLAGTVTVNSLDVDGVYTAAASRAVGANAGKLVIAPNGTNAATSVTNFLRLESASSDGSLLGSLDVSDNKLIYDYSLDEGKSPLGGDLTNLPTKEGLLATRVAVALWSSYAGGRWTGKGITSGRAQTVDDPGTPEAEPVSVYSVGYAEASRLLGISGTETATFGGKTVDATSILMMGTYGGDANLDGVVDADDYSIVDRGLALQDPAELPHNGANDQGQFKQWQDGDFDYNGIVTSADLLILDKSWVVTHPADPGLAAMLANREARFGSDYVAALIASVPEPTSLSLLAPAVLGLAGRRRRTRA